MLQIIVPDTEVFDEKRQEIYTLKGCKLQLEHSLVSLSKWESKWKKPFLVKNDKTSREILDYVKCMTITQNVNSYIYNCLTPQNLQDITDYIDDPMTATTISNPRKATGKNEILTSELIYYYMFAAGIPKECEKWHLNRLFMLLRVFGIKNDTKPKKMNREEYLNHRRLLNEQRKAKHKSHG